MNMTKRIAGLAVSLLVAAGLSMTAQRPAFALLPLCHPVSTAGMAQASAAMALYLKQKYAAAFARLEPLAQGGNPYAQNQLGIMFNRGIGVARDYEAAADWWRRAADQGQATAQCNLGLMYLYGQGVPQDDVQAYVYFNVAAARGSKDARRRRDMMEAWRMTASELQEAQELSRNWGADK